MNYKECPKCGVAPEPCGKESGLPDANQNSPKRDAKPHGLSINQDREKSKGNLLRDLRLSKNIQAKEMVTTVCGLCPKYDEVLQSKCEHGDEYGIDLRADAMEALLEKYAPAELERERMRRSDRHRLKCKVCCRLRDAEYAELMKYIVEDGFDTTQAWLALYIRAYLKAKKEKNKKEQKDND